MQVTDRIRALHDAGNVDSARQLAREVVRNRTSVSASLSDGELVVSVPGFTGRHPVSVGPEGDAAGGGGAVVDVGRGRYRLDDGPAFEVTVHSLWDAAESAAAPVLYAAARERGFERLDTLAYAVGRSEVDYRGEAAPERAAAEPTDDSDPAASDESARPAGSGVLRAVRQLIR